MVEVVLTQCKLCNNIYHFFIFIVFDVRLKYFYKVIYSY